MGVREVTAFCAGETVRDLAKGLGLTLVLVSATKRGRARR